LRAAASDEGHEDGLELVLGMVGDGDVGAPFGSSEALEGGVAEAAGGGFSVAFFGADLDLGLDELEAKEVCQGPGDIAVGEGLITGAEIVDDVGDNEKVGRTGDGSRQSEDQARGVAAA
jgi:hypothetical protein